MELDAIDRAIINRLQGGFPVCERPYAQAAESLGLSEEALIARIGKLVEGGALNLACDNLYLWAALPCIFIAWKWKSLFGTVLAGMLLVALARLFLS